LGQIDKIELDQKSYNDLWEGRIRSINSHQEDEADSFFRSYLRAKYSDNRRDGQRFDGDYHRVMFGNHMEEKLRLNHNPDSVRDFLDHQFSYYSTLYEKLVRYTRTYHEAQPYLFFNRLNDLNSQFIMILSSCELSDADEENKVLAVSRELDRFFTLLHLQNVHDSNRFTEKVYEISADIREKPVDEYRGIFDGHLTDILSDRRNAVVSAPIQYAYFRNTGIGLPPRFKRYFFARIEKFLADNLRVGMKHSIGDLVSKTGAKTGFHIEHILAHNESNLAQFGGDAEHFEQERNRLGGILLLKGRDNISSNAEPYAAKLQTYANTLHWNETLREDSYKSKLDMRDLKRDYQLSIRHLDQFGPDELEERQRLLFDMIKLIWE
jgi:hypothetical protein